MMAVMGLRQFGCLPLALLTGCSILYNPDNLPRIDAAEPPVDAATDSDPSRLTVTGFDVGTSAATIAEGSGAANGRPTIVLLAGTSIVGGAAGAVVTAGFLDAPAGGAGPTVVGFDAYSDGTGGAVAVRIPVLPDLAAGQARMMRITLTQGAATGSVDIPIDGLAELRLTAAAAATVDATPERYSQIEIVGDVHYAPDQADPVILRATGGITFINSRLDVDAAGRLPGPHGCAGGLAASGGTCSPGGGGAGSNVQVIADGSGGGGGGFGAAAPGGAGGEGGAGGMITGNDMLVPVVSPANVGGNRGNGGGGGGPGQVVVPIAGGQGGGGGGVLVLEAGGDITVTGAGGLLRAAGAPGSEGAGASGGGGGGGSGGALLVRSGGAITATGVWLAAPGGNPGPGNLMGAAGQVGRIRIDAAAGEQAAIAAMATTPAPVRGPAWDVATPTIAATAAVTLRLRAQPGRTFGISVNDQAVSDATTGGTGIAMVPLTLRRGRNPVCAAWARNQDATNLDRPEARTCIDIAYVGP